MAIETRPSGGLQSEINVTPLVDVVLVLLIIFMVIVPLTMRGYDLVIPGESADPPREPELEQIVLAIEPELCPALEPPESAGLPVDCRVRFDRASVPVAELASRLSETYAGRDAEHRVLFLAADDRLNYEAVMRIVDAAKGAVAGLRIGLVTERDST